METGGQRGDERDTTSHPDTQSGSGPAKGGVVKEVFEGQGKRGVGRTSKVSVPEVDRRARLRVGRGLGCDSGVLSQGYTVL